MEKYDLIFSINVHEKISFLYKQIRNIKEYVILKYKIILNCDSFMYKSLKNDEFIISNNIILNPYYFTKQRFHGSILQGHYLNMTQVINKYKFFFLYFIILFSKNIFYNKLENINQINKLKYDGCSFEEIKKKSWWKNHFIRLKLVDFLVINKSLFSTSPHEGLTLDYNICKKIISFLEGRKNIKKQLFTFKSSIEEFAFQSLSCYFCDHYYNIGTMTTQTIDKININKLDNKFIVCKINRL